MMSPSTLFGSLCSGIPWRVRAAVLMAYGIAFVALGSTRPSWFDLDSIVLAGTLGTYLTTWYWLGFVDQKGYGRGYLWTAGFCAVVFTVLSLIALLT